MKKKMLLSATAAVGLATVFSLGIGSVSAATYTSTQVAAHSTSADCWEIINGKVYDVTAFVSQHSGGASAVLAQCGKDASVVFSTGPHSSSSLAALAPYLLGDSATGVSTKPAVVLPAVVLPAVSSSPTPAVVVPTIRHSDDSVSDELEDSDDDGTERHGNDLRGEVFHDGDDSNNEGDDDSRHGGRSEGSERRHSNDD